MQIAEKKTERAVRFSVFTEVRIQNRKTGKRNRILLSAKSTDEIFKKRELHIKLSVKQTERVQYKANYTITKETAV